MTDNRTTERVDHPPRVRDAIDELMREKDANDNRTTELLDGLRSVGNLHEFAELFGFNWEDDSDWTWHDVAMKMADELEQAIAATLGNSRAERTCKQEERGWGTEGDHARVWLTCGHDCMVPTVQDLPNYCPNCGARVVE